MFIKFNTFSNGNDYYIDDKRYLKLEELLLTAKATMINPTIVHMVTWIKEAEYFDKPNFVVNLKRALAKVYKSNKQIASEGFLYAYSIEFKYATVCQIENDYTQHCHTHNYNYSYSYDNADYQLPYLHMHLYLIVDCSNGSNPYFLPNNAEVALGMIEGLDKSHYIKSKDGYKFRKIDDTTADDIFNRLLYIGKVEQKDEYEIPYRQTFSMSKLPKNIKSYIPNYQSYDDVVNW